MLKRYPVLPWLHRKIISLKEMSQLWRQIFASNSYVPPAKERQNSLKPERAENFPFAVVFGGVDLAQIDFDVQYQLRTCFYDAKFGLFFGHPWRSRWIRGRQGENRLIFNETIFFHTLFNDPSVVLVVELATKKRSDPQDEDILEGWCVLRITWPVSGQITDFSHRLAAASTSKTSLFTGSPKMLIFLTEPMDTSSKLIKSNGSLNFSFHTHRLLSRGFDFIPENTIFGISDVVPGLEQPENSSALLNPVPKSPLAGFLDELVLHLGLDSERIETELCILSNKERLFKANQLAESTEEMIILERRIRIGIHNGWSFIKEPMMFHLSSESHSATHSLRKKGTSGKAYSRTRSWDPRAVRKVTLYLKNRVDLNDLVADPGLAIIFILDFLVGLKTQKVSEPTISTTIIPAVPQPAPRKVKKTVEKEPERPPLPTEPPPSNTPQPLQEESTDVMYTSTTTKTPIPKPPSRKGRPPLTQQTYEQPNAVQPAIPLPYPPVVPGGAYQWPAQHALALIPQPPVAFYGKVTELPQGSIHAPVFSMQQQSIGPTSPQSSGATNLPHNVFFTFTFYRFPQVSTERLLVVMRESASQYPPGCPMILRRIDRLGNMISDEPGYQVKFMVDPEYLKPGEQKVFFHYMIRNSVNIDVWDGDSLMLLGSCLLPLKHLCRGSREAVQGYCQLPIVTTELRTTAGSSDSLGGDGLTAVIRAFLYIKVANVGYPHMNSSALGIGDDTGRISLNSAVISHSLQRLDSSSRSSTRVRAQPMKIGNQYAGSQFVIGQKMELNAEEMSEEKKRKMNRLESLRQIERHLNAPLVRRSMVEDLNRNLQTLKLVRQENKHRVLLTALLQSITTVHTIFPSLGSTEFMEFLLENPFGEAITVSIDIDDQELCVITDPKEWHFFKQIHNLTTPLEGSMFSFGETKNEERITQLFLKPREALYIPFKYQTFHSIEHPFGTTVDEEEKSRHRKTVLLQSKSIQASFKRADTEELISCLFLQVEPQPHIVHQTFRFYHPENSFFVKYFRLRPLQLPGVRGFYSVNCTDSAVICELQSDPQGGQQDVFLKVGCGSSPQVKSFCLMLYGDPFESRPLETWQIHIHAAQRIDVNTVQGHTSRFSLVLKGGQASRMVRCFSSSPQELKCQPAEPFLLQPGTVMEIQSFFKPLFTGERTFQITAVDVELQELVHCWLICASVRSPNVSKAYQVNIPVNVGQPINKKISYQNQYSVQRTFYLATNRDDVLSFKEGSIRLAPHASGTLAIRFLPKSYPHTVDVLVFINDEEGNNEDTVAIKAVYCAV